MEKTNQADGKPELTVLVQQHEDGNVEDCTGRRIDGPFACRPHKPQNALTGLRWWLPETVASVGSMLLMAVLVVVLAHYDGKGIVELHLPRHFTLNSIVSLITTFIHSAMALIIGSVIAQELWLYFAEEACRPNCSSRLGDLNVFDGASRGLTGCLAFLIHFRGRRLVPTLAAFLTVLMLAFGTFIQNLVSYDSLVSANSPSLHLNPGQVPRTEYWGSYSGQFAAPEVSPIDIPLKMSGALYAAVMDVPSSPLTMVCPSGTCTWPDTPSLAVCGGCVSSTFEKTSCWSTTGMDDVEISLCNYTLASGNQVTLDDWSKERHADYPLPAWVSMPTKGAHYTDDSVAYFAKMDMFGAEYNELPGPKAMSLQAFECAMWMCVQTFETAYLGGYTSETVLATQDATTIDSSIDNPVYTFDAVPKSADPDGETSFVVTSEALDALHIVVTPVLTATVNETYGEDEVGNNIARSLWKSTSDLDSWMDNLALSMTNIVRTTNMTFREEYRGSALQLGVRIRWAWLIAPVLMLAATIALLAAVMVRTVRSPVQAWKGSPITYLLLDLDPDLRREVFGQKSRPGGIEDVAARASVRLFDHSDNAWVFQTC